MISLLGCALVETTEVLRFRPGSLRAVAHDMAGAVRAVELEDHSFFIATLFQPERTALKGQMPPLAHALVLAAMAHAAKPGAAAASPLRARR